MREGLIKRMKKWNGRSEGRAGQGSSLELGPSQLLQYSQHKWGIKPYQSDVA